MLFLFSLKQNRLFTKDPTQLSVSSTVGAGCLTWLAVPVRVQQLRVSLGDARLGVQEGQPHLPLIGHLGVEAGRLLQHLHVALLIGVAGGGGGEQRLGLFVIRPKQKNLLPVAVTCQKKLG